MESVGNLFIRIGCVAAYLAITVFGAGGSAWAQAPLPAPSMNSVAPAGRLAGSAQEDQADMIKQVLTGLPDIDLFIEGELKKASNVADAKVRTIEYMTIYLDLLFKNVIRVYELKPRYVPRTGFERKLKAYVERSKTVPELIAALKSYHQDMQSSLNLMNDNGRLHTFKLLVQMDERIKAIESTQAPAGSQPEAKVEKKEVTFGGALKSIVQPKSSASLATSIAVLLGVINLWILLTLRRKS